LPKDKVFSSDKARGSDFEFNDEVAKVFDDMLVRSVPFYLEQQSLVADIVRKFWVEGTNIYDLGCSTGTTLINLSKVVPASARLVGYDNSKSMV
jgi:tRNA (cmo5U34)-methyltransferase